MSERDLFLLVVRLVVGTGLGIGFLLVRPRLSRQRRARGQNALFVRILALLYLLIILGYFGLFLPRFQRYLFG